MTAIASQPSAPLSRRARAFTVPDRRRSIRQVATTFALYAATWASMAVVLPVSYVWTLLLAIPAAGLTLRIWVLQHDLGHGALFRRRWVNDAIGCVCGLVTLLPYYHWRRVHNMHHAHSGNLDRRGPGYLTTLTVREYEAQPWWGRLAYRVYRNPLVILIPGAWYYFLLQHRVPYSARRDWRRERLSVYLTNMAIVGIGMALASAIGWWTVLLIHLPIVCLASSVGAWIFIAQHSFEDTYWATEEHWDFERSALEGSSFYDMSRIMRWFTADVGYHHVHHLNPRIPNYRLASCHEAIPELRAVTPLTGRELWRTARMALWDEDRRRMVSFSALRSRP